MSPRWPDSFTPLATYARAAPKGEKERIVFVSGEVLEEDTETLRVLLVLDQPMERRLVQSDFAPEQWLRLKAALVEEFSALRGVQQVAREYAIAKARAALAKLDGRAS